MTAPLNKDQVKPQVPVDEAFSPADMARRRKRSIAMALVLLGLMVLFFISTIVRLGGNMAGNG